MDGWKGSCMQLLPFLIRKDINLPEALACLYVTKMTST